MSSYARQLWESLPSVEGVTEAAGAAAGAATDVVRDAAGAAADYGNDAVQRAMEAGQGAVEAGQGVLQGAVDTGTGLARGAVDAGTGLLAEGAEQIGLDWTQDPAIGTTEEGQEPEQAVDTPVQAEEPPQVDEESVYKDQIDNESPYVPGHSSCSPTSFTMALIAMHGGDEASVRAQTIGFLEEIGARTDYEQTEELIIELLQKTDWASVYKSHKQFFWGDWITKDKNVKAGTYYKDPYAQQYLASRYSGAALTEAQFVNVKQRSDWDTVAATLDAGGQATAEGDFTDAGHVVQILAVEGDGITINDPYGLWVTAGVYIRNGAEQVPGLGSTDIEALKTRASKNSTLLDAYESFASPEQAMSGFDRWGERNFYTYADAEALNLGKWVSLLS